MTETEKIIVRELYKMTVPFAHSSHITKRIYRMYPEAFFEPRIIEKVKEEITGWFPMSAHPKSVCGKKGIDHRMKRWNCYSTTCINDGCNERI